MIVCLTGSGGGGASAKSGWYSAANAVEMAWASGAPRACSAAARRSARSSATLTSRPRSERGSQPNAGPPADVTGARYRGRPARGTASLYDVGVGQGLRVTPRRTVGVHVAVAVVDALLDEELLDVAVLDELVLVPPVPGT